MPDTFTNGLNRYIAGQIPIYRTINIDIVNFRVMYNGRKKQNDIIFPEFVLSPTVISNAQQINLVCFPVHFPKAIANITIAPAY